MINLPMRACKALAIWVRCSSCSIPYAAHALRLQTPFHNAVRKHCSTMSAAQPETPIVFSLGSKRGLLLLMRDLYLCCRSVQKYSWARWISFLGKGQACLRLPWQLLLCMPRRMLGVTKSLHLLRLFAGIALIAFDYACRT